MRRVEAAAATVAALAHRYQTRLQQWLLAIGTVVVAVAAVAEDWVVRFHRLKHP